MPPTLNLSVQDMKDGVHLHLQPSAVSLSRFSGSGCSDGGVRSALWSVPVPAAGWGAGAAPVPCGTRGGWAAGVTLQTPGWGC